MKRTIAILLALVLTLAALSGCGGTKTSSSAGNAASGNASAGSSSGEADTGLDALDPVELTFSTQASQDVEYVKAMYRVQEKIAEMSGGKLTMVIHDNGSLMTQEGEIDACARGTLDMYFSSPFLISDQLDYLSMFTAAYIYKNADHMLAVWNGDIGQKVVEDVADHCNVRWLSFIYCGSRHLLLRDIGKEVHTPEDMAGVNLRMPNSDAWLFMGRALGANPTPMAFAEVYTGLQTGAIDGQENPLQTDIAQKWYEVSSQVVLTGHCIEPMCVAINEDLWQSLAPEYQEILTTALKESIDECNATNVAAEQECIEFMRNQGLTVIEPDLDAFMEYAENYYLADADMTASWDMDLYREIKDMDF